MPKVLEDIQEKILDTVRERVAFEGWNAVNIRGLAKRCGIASGTIYNYYPSREAVLAAVISRDWEKAEESILVFFNGSTPGSGDMKTAAMDRLRFLCGVLSGFTGVYRKVWAESPGHLSGRAWERGRRDRLLFRARMEDLVRKALDGAEVREGIDTDFFISFLSRAIVDWSGEEDFDFSKMEPVITAFLV